MDTIETVLIVISIGALLFVVSRYRSELLQPDVIHRLRRDARLARDTLVGLEDIDPDVKVLLRRFDERLIVAANETYTKNKRHIRVCLGNDTRYGHDINYAMILFSLLHEMAHVMTPEYGHTPNFWQNFIVILEVADVVGVLDKEMVERGLALDPPFILCAHKMHTGYMPPASDIIG